MDKYTSIIQDWNERIKREKSIISRTKYMKKIENLIDLREIIILNGIRRAGKSTILIELIQKLRRKLGDKNSIYINFEDPRFQNGFNGVKLIELANHYVKKVQDSERFYLFLDEIQNIENWEKALFTIYETHKNVKVFATGSTASLFMSKELTALSGRYVKIHVSPLDFGEFLKFKKIKKRRKNYANLLREYLEYGGFPEIVLAENSTNKLNLLVSYYESILERDVIIKNGIRNINELKSVARIVMSSVGTQISTYKLEKQLKMSNVTISRYMQYLEDAYLISRVKQFSYSVRKQTYNPDKIFSTDTGLAKIAGFKFSDNLGHYLENAVYNKLKEKDLAEIFYWQNGTEIDLLEFFGNEVTKLVNVATTVDDKEVYKREIQSLEKASKKFPKAEKTLLTLYNQSGKKDEGLISIIEFLRKYLHSK